MDRFGESRFEAQARRVARNEGDRFEPAQRTLTIGVATDDSTGDGTQGAAAAHGGRAELPSYLKHPKPERREHLPLSQRERVEVSRAIAKSALAPEQKLALRQAAEDPATARRLDRILDGARELPDGARAKLLGRVAKDPSGSQAAVIDQVMRSDTWDKVGEDGRRQLAKVLGASTERGAALLGRMVEKTPERLLDRDSHGRTLLANLSRLSSHPLNSSLDEAGRSAILEDVIRDVAMPKRVDQGSKGDVGTCTVASMQYELARDNPSELARLMVGLTGPDGKVKMRNGERLWVQPGFLENPNDSRSLADSIFQSAAMEYANGKLNYDARRDISSPKGKPGKVAQRGLDGAQQIRMLEALFGTKYEAVGKGNLAHQKKLIEFLRSRPSFESERPIILNLDMGKTNHAVTFMRVENGRVFYRDPYGEVESMSVRELRRRLTAVHAPEGQLPGGLAAGSTKPHSGGVATDDSTG
ncbi:MAG: hypothetical protein HYZ28_14440 [Myxococcales bacterium]|nr:hypothetical protein [Myxococcales bacterium]